MMLKRFGFDKCWKSKLSKGTSFFFHLYLIKLSNNLKQHKNISQVSYLYLMRSWWSVISVCDTNTTSERGSLWGSIRFTDHVNTIEIPLRLGFRSFTHAVNALITYSDAAVTKACGCCSFSIAWSAPTDCACQGEFRPFTQASTGIWRHSVPAEQAGIFQFSCIFKNYQPPSVFWHSWFQRIQC